MGSIYATTSDIDAGQETGTVTWVDSNTGEWEVDARSSENVEFIYEEEPPPPPLPPPRQSFPDRPRCGYRLQGRRPVFNGVRMFVK